MKKIMGAGNPVRVDWRRNGQGMGLHWESQILFQKSRAWDVGSGAQRLNGLF